MARVEGITQAATVRIAGTPISAQVFDRLAEARVETSSGAAGWFQLRFASDEPLGPEFAIGAEVQIDFDDESGSAVAVFHGTIDSLAVEYDRGTRQLTVSGYDHRRKLGSTPVVKAYTNQSYGGIIGEIAQQSGLQSRIDSAANSPQFVHVLQTTSDIQFVSQLTRRLGMDWHVEDKVLVVAPRSGSSTIELEFGEQLRRFSARYTATEHPAEVTVRGWDPARKEALVANDSTALGSPANTVPIESSSRSTSANGRTATTWASPLASLDEGTLMAKAIGRRMASGDLTGRGETNGDPRILPGVQCEISGIDDNWNGTYYISSAEHVYRRDDPYLTRFTVGSYESSSLVDLMGPGGTAGTGSGVGFGHGVTVGIVTNNANTDTNHGEVKVKFPYLDERVESQWARIATIGAGNARGVMFMPEVNDEVLVAFEHGDITRPYVIGSVWNGEDAPPLQRQQDDLNKRTIVSKLGHKLTFFDGSSDDKKNVAIELADGATKLHLGHDKIEIIANNGKPIEIKNDKAKLVLLANGDVRIEGENVSIKASQDFKVEGQKVETSSMADTKLAATGSIEVKGNATAKVTASGPVELKGAIVKAN